MEKKMIIMRGLEGNSPTQLKGAQVFLEPYVQEILVFWWTVFWITMLVLLYNLFKAWKKNFKK
jgi:hypothetical protein